LALLQALRLSSSLIAINPVPTAVALTVTAGTETMALAAGTAINAAVKTTKVVPALAWTYSPA
jgi:hypothetical protein